MSRLVVSSYKNYVERFRNHNLKVGLVESYYSSNEEVSICTFKKMNVDNVNYYKEGIDFIVISGTLIYKGNIGIQSLANLLADYKKYRNVDIIRKEAIGNYLIVLRSGEEIVSFCDPNNIYYGYYYIGKDGWCVSNSLYEMAISIADGLTIDEDVLLEEMYCRCIIGNETVFKEIKRIQGEEVLIIEKGNLKTKKINSAMEPKTPFVESFTEELKNICSTIGRCFNQDVSVAMTGGMDSRFVLAGLLGAGLKPHLYYGKGNSLLAETKPRDEQICKEIAERTQLKLSFLDWSIPEQINKDWSELELRYGFLSRLYSGSKVLQSSLENIENVFITYGYFGESYSYENTATSSTFSLDDFLDYYIGTRVPLLAANYEQFRKHIADKCKKVMGLISGDITEYSVDQWIKLELEMRRKKDSLLVNFSNQHRYSIAILGEPSLLKYSFIPVKYKMNRRFLIQSINILNHDLIEIPVFTHMENRTIDMKRMELTVPVKMRLRSFVKKKFHNNSFRHFLIRLNQLMSGTKGADEMVKNDVTREQLIEIAQNRSYVPHSIFAEKSTNLSLEARYLMTVEMLEIFKS